MEASAPAVVGEGRHAAARSLPIAFGAGAAVGVLGGLIGLGGAEFRLPLLIGVFGLAALSAVILNKAMSLLVVLTTLPARPAHLAARFDACARRQRMLDDTARA